MQNLSSCWLPCLPTTQQPPGRSDFACSWDDRQCSAGDISASSLPVLFFCIFQQQEMPSGEGTALVVSPAPTQAAIAIPEAAFLPVAFSICLLACCCSWICSTFYKPADPICFHNLLWQWVPEVHSPTCSKWSPFYPFWSNLPGWSMASNSHHAWAPAPVSLYDFVGLARFAPPSPEKIPSLPRTPSDCSYPTP